MVVIRLKPGERASDMADSVHIYALGEGRYSWGGSVAYAASAVFRPDDGDYPSYQAAEAEALAWAAHHRVETLYIETPDA